MSRLVYKLKTSAPPDEGGQNYLQAQTKNEKQIEKKKTKHEKMKKMENGKLENGQEEGVTMADSAETLGVDLRTRVQKFWSKRKSEKKQVQSEILAF